MIIDTHAHLNTVGFHQDLLDVLERAKKHNVKKIIVIGMDETSNHLAILLAQTYDMLYASVGIHPGYVDDFIKSHQDLLSDTQLDAFISHHLEVLLNQDKVIAIGECGLDLYWNKDNYELQKKIFIAQIELAKKTKMPLIIHSRNSFNETLECLIPYQGEVTGVFHCFSSHLEDAKKAIALGFYIGIDGPITFKKAEELINIVKHIDLKHILVETDSPYLSPMPYRGKRNEPGYVRFVVEKIAEIKRCTIDEVMRITTQNAYNLFHIGGFYK